MLHFLFFLFWRFLITVEFIHALLGDIFGVPKENLESIIGATIGAYLKLLSSEKAGLEELNRLVCLAKRYSSCSQVLVAVADYLDFIYG